MIKQITIDGRSHEIGGKSQNIDYQNVSMPGVSNVKQALDGLELGFVKGRNIYNSADTTQRLDDKCINSDGDILSLNGYAVAKIQCKPNTEYIVHNTDGLWGGRRVYAFYDEYMNVIGSVKNWTVLVESTPEYTGDDIPIDEKHRRITTPENCRFIAIQVAGGQTSNWAAFDIRYSLMVEEGSYPTEYDNGAGEFISTIGGKKIVAVNSNVQEKKYDIPLNTYIMGDSTATFAMGYWPGEIVKKFSFKHFYGIAKGGSTYGVRKDADADDIKAGDNSKQENNTIITQVYELINKVTNENAPVPELIIIHAGTNDVTEEFANSSATMQGNPNDTEVGDADTTFDYSNVDYRDWSNIPLVDDRTNTAMGGMRLALETIRATWPYCKVLVTTPLQRNTNVSGDYKLLTIYRKCVEQIRKAAWYLSVPCLDLSAEAGITATNILTFTSDAVHPNANGGKRLADVIGRYLVAHYGQKDWYI